MENYGEFNAREKLLMGKLLLNVKIMKKRLLIKFYPIPSLESKIKYHMFWIAS